MSSLRRVREIVVITVGLFSTILVPASGDDPPADDDADILEVLFDATSSNDELVDSYKATYGVTYFDRTVSEPTTKEARAVGGSAVMRYEVLPERNLVQSISSDGDCVQATTVDSTGRTVEIVGLDLNDGTWEIYSPDHKRLELMLPADLPARLPIRPRRLWMEEFGGQHSEYVASICNSADTDIYIRGDGSAGITALRDIEGVEIFNAIQFSPDDGLLPALAVTGYDGEISSVVKIAYKQLANGGRIADLASIYYVAEGVEYDIEFPFELSIPPAHKQEVRFELTDLVEPCPTPVAEIVPDEGTDVIDMVQSKRYTVTNKRAYSTDDAYGGFSLWQLAVTNAAILSVIACIYITRLRRRHSQ